MQCTAEKPAIETVAEEVPCIGTMFLGAATNAASAHHLLSLAADRGVNIFDTAEMYPVPQSAQSQGQSETTLGNWLKTQRRCLVYIE